MNQIQQERVNRKLKTELGPLVVQALEDPKVVEIMLNSDGTLWQEKLGQGMESIGEMPASQAFSLLSTIATSLGTQVTVIQPILEGELPIDGSRFEGLIPPVVARPTFTIRKKASQVFRLSDYVKQNALTLVQQYHIVQAVKQRKNILVVGGTGSGKTTLTNAIIQQIVHNTPEHRLVIIEDTAEIQCSAKNAVSLRSTETVDMQKLLKATMRLRPDRILVGEVRGPEALTLLKSWNTGHPGGVATVHANSAAAGLIRMEQLIAEATTAPMQSLIAEAVHLVIFIEKTPDGRKISEMLSVAGFDHQTQQYLLSPIKKEIQ